MPAVVDALGRQLRFPMAPRRIVSLVPSLTETLFALGAGESVVGVTEYCVHPADGVRGLAVVGGTKNPDVGRILALHPDLVIANVEENRKRDVERLIDAGIAVLVAYARSVADAVREISELGAIARRGSAALEIVGRIERALVRARERRPASPPRVVALVWKQPYMAVGGDAFAHDLLVQCGAENPLASAERRYPRLDERELERLAPDVILLPTEPFAFGERDRQELLRLDCPAARQGRIHVVEGELLSWYGPRIARALDLFSELLSTPAGTQGRTL